MYTHKSRVLAALRGEMVDRLPYVPRLDLWYLANSTAGTLPKQYVGTPMNEIARAEGWAFHHRFCDDQLDPAYQPLYLHRGINVFYSRDTLFDVVLPKDVEVKVHRDGPRTRVEYHTPLGMVSTTTHYDVDSQRHGITIPALVEHLIKTPADYAPAGYLFEHMDVVANFERFRRWAADDMGENGQPIAIGSLDASPFHLIQRDLSNATQFFIHYKDHYREMRGLAERIAPLMDKQLEILSQSPAEVVWWGANFDDMLTFPPYFAQEIAPWIRKAATRLGAAGKLVLCHTDGENRGLMDLIRDSGMHVAESFCPAPMTKVTLAEYYRHWSGNLTLFGGIPSTVVMPGTSEADFEAYLDELFRAVAPGQRIVIGVADEVPPSAVFSRLQRIGERIEKEGRLPLQAGAFRPAPVAPAAARPAAEAAAAPAGDAYDQVRHDVFKGKHLDITAHVQALLDRGVHGPRHPGARPHRGHHRGGRSHGRRRCVHSGSPAGRPCHGHRRQCAGAGARRQRRAAARQSADRHRQRRHARYRQEPGGDDAEGRRLRGARPRDQRAPGEVLRRDRRFPAGRPRTLLAADDDHDGNARDRRRGEGARTCTSTARSWSAGRRSVRSTRSRSVPTGTRRTPWRRCGSRSG